MGSRRGPSGPSPEEIARQAREQSAKVKFEDAKGRYLGRVASREIAAASGRERAMGSLEYEEMQRGGFVPESSLFIPERFAPETSTQYKPRSADFAFETVAVGSQRYKDLISQGYKPTEDIPTNQGRATFAGTNPSNSIYFGSGNWGGVNMVTLQRGTDAVAPEEAEYSWFTAANLGFTNIAQEYNLAQRNVTKDSMSYNKALFENLLKYDQWNSSANPLAQAERQQVAETFRSQYGGLTEAQIESGAWKQDIRNQQRYAGMLYASENLARGQLGI